MKAAVIVDAGDSGHLEIQDIEEPQPSDDEILVRVRATALNRADLLQVRGRYPAPPGVRADVPGLEFAGEVEAVGSAVQLWKPGDRVMGLLGGGGYAEKIVVHERVALPIPEGLSFEEAAAIPEVFLTAYNAVFLQMGLQMGERLLIHAVASGVGTAALQLAKASGATVFGTSRTASKLDQISELGLDFPIDTTAQDFAEEVLANTNKQGVHVVLDLVGASLWQGNMRALANRGRMIIVGLVGGVKTEADLSMILRKRLTVVGTVLRARPLEEKIELSQAFRERALPLFLQGKLRPIVDEVYPLENVNEAFLKMAENRNAGKIILKV